MVLGKLQEFVFGIIVNSIAKISWPVEFFKYKNLLNSSFERDIMVIGNFHDPLGGMVTLMFNRYIQFFNNTIIITDKLGIIML